VIGPRHGRRTWLIVTTLAVLLAVTLLGRETIPSYVWSIGLDRAVRALDRVSVDPALLATGGDAVTRFLVVGDDSRAGDRHDADIQGVRGDSVAIWTIGSQGTTILALPRDLRVEVAAHGPQKLSGVADYGANAEIRAVAALTALPINHYVDLRFDGFRALVDAVGGLDLMLPESIRDAETGLNLHAGRQRLDGSESLRYVRSRQAQVLVNGHWEPADPGDLGRIVRQQQLLGAVVISLRQHSKPWLVRHSARLLRTTGVSVDQRFTSTTLSSLLEFLAEPRQSTFCTLPTRWQVPDGWASSPFSPGRGGSTNLRVAGPASAAMLRWIGSAQPAGQLPSGCSLASAMPR